MVLLQGATGTPPVELTYARAPEALSTRPWEALIWPMLGLKLLTLKTAGVHAMKGFIVVAPHTTQACRILPQALLHLLLILALDPTLLGARFLVHTKQR